MENTSYLQGVEDDQRQRSDNQGKDSTTTKATLTEGKITLNKDSNPTETTAKALGINTDITEANQQVEAPKDVNQLLKEQQLISQNMGEIGKAASVFSSNRAKEAAAEAQKAQEELKQAQKEGNTATIAEKQVAYLEAQAKVESWSEGGSAKRKVDTAVAVLGSILSGKTTAQTAVAAVSPELNAQIHELTKESKIANLFAHAALSATEFYAAGLDPVTGALAVVAGEGSAMLLAEKVFNKKPSELTAEEKSVLKTASQLAGVVVGGVTGNTTATAVEGMATAKRAVENNYLKAQESLAFEKEMVACKSSGGDCTDIIQKYIEISNRNFAELGLNKCKGGGVVCITKEEIVQAETNVALVKHDSHGRFYLGESLRDDDTINLVKYLNGNDLSYLRNNITTSDRLAAVVMDPTSWPFLILGTKNLIQNNAKSNLFSTGIAMTTNAGFQYGASGKVDLGDVISAGLVNQVSAGKNFSSTANWNTIGEYYSAKIKGESSYDNALLSRVSAQGGYAVGKIGENSLQPIFNPYRNSYGAKAWKDIGMGMSKSIQPNNIPSTMGSISGSNTSEGINLLLKKENEK